MKELLTAGIHLGHPRHLWNPKMARYIWGSMNNIYIIDLQKTIRKFEEALEFIKARVASGESLLFVGTKCQAQEAIEESARQTGMFSMSQRWLGGTLTNFTTIRKSVKRLEELEKAKQDGTHDKLTKKEVMRLEKERGKLDKALSGIQNMDRLPGVVFVIDIIKERICVAEARRLNIPIVAIVDTNCDPEAVDYAIPGNDDGIRSIRFITQKIVEAVMEGIRQRAVPVLSAEVSPALSDGETLGASGALPFAEPETKPNAL